MNTHQKDADELKENTRELRELHTPEPAKTVEMAIELLTSAHVSTDLVWKRHDCVEALKTLLTSHRSSIIEEVVKELERVVAQNVWNAADRLSPHNVVDVEHLDTFIRKITN